MACVTTDDVTEKLLHTTLIHTSHTTSCSTASCRDDDDITFLISLFGSTCLTSARQDPCKRTQSLPYSSSLSEQAAQNTKPTSLASSQITMKLTVEDLHHVSSVVTPRWLAAAPRSSAFTMSAESTRMVHTRELLVCPHLTLWRLRIKRWCDNFTYISKTLGIWDY